MPDTIRNSLESVNKPLWKAIQGWKILRQKVDTKVEAQGEPLPKRELVDPPTHSLSQKCHLSARWGAFPTT